VTYALNVPGNVQRYLERLQPKVRDRIIERLESLALDPLDANTSKALHGEQASLRSSRLGNVRILYEILEEVRVVDINDIGPRGDVYKR
jgi:mRNA interferase RelE/StbE